MSAQLVPTCLYSSSNSRPRATMKRAVSVLARQLSHQPLRRTYAHISKPPKQGQPHPRTHPHLLRTSELTPGILPREYEARRKALMESLPDGAVVVCMGNTVRLVSQLSAGYGCVMAIVLMKATDFAYLTGFMEPDATLVLESKPSTSRGYRYTLFVPPKDDHEALWQGERTGVQGAISTFNADAAFPNTSLPSHLASLMDATDLFVSLPPSPSPSPSSQPFQPPSPRRRSSLLKLFTQDTWTHRDPPHLMLAAALASERARPLERHVHALRLVKSTAELALMLKAGQLSGDAHAAVMRFAEPGMTEAMLQAKFEFECAMGGSERPAYVPVVASGENALVIHYTNNDCTLDDGEMVLIDAGCEYGMYASDITRTFPVNGTFSPAQRDLYQAVLNVQKECVKQCVGDVTLNELHRTSCVLLTEELRQIGFKLSTGDVERRLYPHFLSHHLGSDLHDCPTVDRNGLLRDGNVITIEPGCYVPNDPSFPSAFHGLGIRIEDEVAITPDGPLVLSAHAPKEVVDVEGACQGVLDRVT